MDLIEIMCSVYEQMEYIIKEMQTIKINQMKKLIDLTATLEAMGETISELRGKSIEIIQLKYKRSTKNKFV